MKLVAPAALEMMKLMLVVLNAPALDPDDARFDEQSIAVGTSDLDVDDAGAAEDTGSDAGAPLPLSPLCDRSRLRSSLMNAARPGHFSVVTEVDVDLEKNSALALTLIMIRSCNKKLRAPGFEPGRSESWSTACVRLAGAQPLVEKLPGRPPLLAPRGHK